MSGDTPVPMADLQDMGKWVKALFEAPPDLTLVGSTETMSWKEWLQLWADRNSVVAKYRQAPPAEYESKIKGISDAVSEEFQFVERFGFTGGNSDALYPDQVSLYDFSLLVQWLIITAPSEWCCDPTLNYQGPYRSM